MIISIFEFWRLDHYCLSSSNYLSSNKGVSNLFVLKSNYNYKIGYINYIRSYGNSFQWILFYSPSVQQVIKESLIPRGLVIYHQIKVSVICVKEILITIGYLTVERCKMPNLRTVNYQ